MRNALCVIVHGAGEVIGEDVIGAIKHKVADLVLEVLTDPALQQVLKRYFRRLGADAPGSEFASRRNAMAAGSRIDGAAGKRFTDFFSTATTRVDQAIGAELLQRCLVRPCAFALINNLAIPVH